MRGRYLGRSKKNKTGLIVMAAVVLLAAGFYLGFHAGKSLSLPEVAPVAWPVIALWAGISFASGVTLGAAGCALWLFIRHYQRTSKPARLPETAHLDASTLAGLFQTWRRRD